MRGEGLVWWWVSSNPGPQFTAGSDEQNGYWRTISNKTLENGGVHLTELELSVFPFLCVSNPTLGLVTLSRLRIKHGWIKNICPLWLS